MQTKEMHSPFGSAEERSMIPQIPIMMFFLLFLVAFAFLVMIACALAMPDIASQARKLFGGTKITPQRDFLAQLRFLMVCYSSPLVLTGCIAFAHHLVTHLNSLRSHHQKSEETSPFD